MHKLLGLFLGMAALCALAAPARAAMSLQPAFPEAAVHGPGAAKGAVIWSHGAAPGVDLSSGPIDAYTEALRDAGWDVFRLNRPVTVDNEKESSDALDYVVETLHKHGYRKVVLAGQSFGAWLSFMVADRRDDLHAVVATAPARYGAWDKNSFGRYAYNADFLYGMLERMKPTRTMVFFFANDDYDPGGRGPRTEAILAGHGIPHLVIDQPPLLAGHGAGHNYLFARRYGACIAAFIDPDKDPAAARCEPSTWGNEPTGQTPLPADLKISGPEPDTPATAAALSGRWWGWYPMGREVEIVVSKISPTDASFIYSIGPVPGPNGNARYAQRTGKFDGEGIISAGPNLTTISLAPALPGHATLVWKSVDGRSSGKAALTRIQ